jgi:hypothetical protein
MLNASRLVGLLLIPLLILMSACAGTPSEDRSLIGAWSGQIDAGANKVTVITRFEEDQDGVLSGTLETPDQVGMDRLPLSEIAHSEDSLSFNVQAIASSFSGAWSDADAAWNGTWEQSGLKLPLALKKGLPEAKPIIEGLDGTWEGGVERNGRTINFIIRIATSEAGTSATFDSPSFGLSNIPVAGLERDGPRVRFTVPATGVEYDAELAPDGESMTGKWTLPGRPDADVTFVRTQSSASPRKAEAPNRPQHPEPPFSYGVEEVSFSNPTADDVTLSGTLTVPEGLGPFPAVVLITGSGPQDRDQTLFGHKPFAVLADHLTRNGIVVLRYDDRGFGESTGSFSAATSEDFATDANAAIAFLEARPDVDPSKLGVIGHSEGGVVGPLAAVSNPSIDFLIMLAGPGQDFVDIMLSQRRSMAAVQGLPSEAVIASEPVVREIYLAVQQANSREEAQNLVRSLLTPEAQGALGTLRKLTWRSSNSRAIGCATSCSMIRKQPLIR